MTRTRPLRVAVVARAVMPLHGVGGLERSVHDLVRHLAVKGVQITLITPPPGPAWRRLSTDPFASPNIVLRHVRYYSFPFANRRGTTILDRSTSYPIFGLRAGALALSMVRKGDIDIVHGFGAAVLGYARSPERPAPLVFNPQGLEEFGATASKQALFKRLGYTPLRSAVRACAKAADCVIATDRALESTVLRHLRIPADRMRTIPNGIDVAAATALAGPTDGLMLRERHGIAAGETVLLSVGRLEANKGFDVLAAALARAGRADGALSARGWRWVIVGRGPYQRDLDRAIERHGLGRHVLFAGRVPDTELHAWYEAATLFVHPTRYEGSSLVTLEAMAHRRAIVASRAGGLPDKVRSGLNGWLVEPGDAPALAGAIEDAVSDGSRLAAMGAESRLIVEREFAWPVLAQTQIDVYRELLETPRPAGDALGER